MINKKKNTVENKTKKKCRSWNYPSVLHWQNYWLYVCCILLLSLRH